MGEAIRSTAEINLPGFVIEPDQAFTLSKDLGVNSPEELLPLLVPAAQQLARPPISQYRVGAVGLGITGRIFIGVNIEFIGLPLNQTIHAEQFLVANAEANNEPAVKCIAVSSVPCGHCRQFLQEIRKASQIRILVTSDPKPVYRPLYHYLPSPFGPTDLLADDAPLLLETHNNQICDELNEYHEDAAEDKMVICNGYGETEERLKDAAKMAAKAAHSPYSGCAAGFAVVGEKGKRLVAGGYIESAAYNPSLGPVQAALVNWVAGGGGDWDCIETAALVELKDALVSHEKTAKMVLAAVAPNARLLVYRYHRSTAAAADDGSDGFVV